MTGLPLGVPYRTGMPNGSESTRLHQLKLLQQYSWQESYRSPDQSPVGSSRALPVRVVLKQLWVLCWTHWHGFDWCPLVWAHLSHCCCTVRRSYCQQVVAAIVSRLPSNKRKTYCMCRYKLSGTSQPENDWGVTDKLVTKKRTCRRSALIAHNKLIITNLYL